MTQNFQFQILWNFEMVLHCFSLQRPTWRPLELMCNSNLKISRPHVQIFSKCSLCDKNYGQIHEIFCETLLEDSKGKERENLW